MVYKRYSIFPDDRSRGSAVTTEGARSSITIYMDESGNGNPSQPLIVGAVVADSETGDIETEVDRLYRELSSRRSLRGYKGFDLFRRKGFHASTDPLEVSQPFLELIQRSLGFKIHLLATRAHETPTQDENQVISELYEIILADNLLRYRGHSLLTVCIEENDSLRPMLATLPRYAAFRATIKIGKIVTLPQVVVEMVKKGSVKSLAIADYAMLAASRWIADDFSTDLADRSYRGMRQIAPAISYFASIEDGTLVSRKMNLGGS